MMMMMMNDEDFDGSVLIYFMMIKKRELADVIIVNICLFLSLKEIYHVYLYKKVEKIWKAQLLTPIIPEL